jgi:TetR/AcrR family transcriptional regulator
MQQEMIRLRRGEPNAAHPLVERLFRPLGNKMLSVAEEGIRSGELIQVEATQVTYAALGANVFYFLSAPMMRLIDGADPLEPAALEFRRKVAIEYLGQAIFVDREYGAAVAQRVLASTPMPERIAIGSLVLPPDDLLSGGRPEETVGRGVLDRIERIHDNYT